MANYTPSTDFAAKDSLLSGNPNKIVKGTEISAELTSIAAAVATKADASSSDAFQAGATTLGATTATSLNSTPIGNSSASTGAFTTLSASGTVSGAGFTARFAAPGPIGSTTPSTGAFTTLSASGVITASGGTLDFPNDDSDVTWGTSGSRPIIRGNKAAQTVTTYTNSAVRTVVSNTGLSVTGALSATNVVSIDTITNAYRRIELKNSGATQTYIGSSLGIFGTDGANDTAIAAWTGNNLHLGSNGVKQATLSVDGNFGLGVTPSAWNSSAKAFQLGTTGSFWGVGGQSRIGNNHYFDSGSTFRYLTTGAIATDFSQTSSGFFWNIAPSGTAGDAISFTQAMTLDASGNLANIGTYSNAQITTFNIATNTNYSPISIAGDKNVQATGGIGSPLLLNSHDTASVRLSSTGIQFSVGVAERARIDSSGLRLNQTAGGYSDSNSVAFDATSGYAVWNHVTGSSSGLNYHYFAYGGSPVGSITQSGTTAVAYNTTSDHRLKENVRPADAARFMDIEFVDFEWTDGRHDCGVIAHQLASVYPDLVLGEKDATETRTVEITPAVPEVKDEDGNVITPAIPAVTEEQTFPVYQQVNYIGLIGRMGTRIQALQRTVDSLEARIAALEAK